MTSNAQSDQAAQQAAEEAAAKEAEAKKAANAAKRAAANKTPEQLKAEFERKDRELIEKAFKKLVWIEIQVDSSDTGSDDVPVRACGRQCRIKRGEAVQVPEPFVEALRNAVQDTYVSRRDEKTGKELFIKKASLSYPYAPVPGK